MFAGPHPSTRALCGHLTMRHDEADDLFARLEATEQPDDPEAAAPLATKLVNRALDQLVAAGWDRPAAGLYICSALKDHTDAD